MKEGFYLSPDGLHIVELEIGLYCSKVIHNYLRYGDVYSSLVHNVSLEYLFSAWEILE